MLKGALRPLRQGRQDQILSAGPASRGSQTPALPKGRARQGVLMIVCRGVWTGLRMAGLDGVWLASGLVGVWLACLDCAPASNPPSCATGAQGLDATGRTKERRADKLCPAGVRQGPLPAGSSAPSGTPCLKPASGLLTPLTAAEAGRAACPGRPPRAPASGRALPARWQRGRRRKGGRLAGGTSSPLPAGKAMLVLGKQASMPCACGTRPAFFRPRSRPGPEPGQSRSRPASEVLPPLGSPSAFPRKPRGEPRTASDRTGSALGSAEPCRLKFVLFQTVPKKQRRHWTSRIKRALPPPSAGPADPCGKQPCGKRTHAESGRGEASGNMGLAHGAQAPPEAGRRCSSSLQSLAPQASARARA